MTLISGGDPGAHSGSASSSTSSSSNHLAAELVAPIIVAALLIMYFGCYVSRRRLRKNRTTDLEARSEAIHLDIRRDPVPAPPPAYRPDTTLPTYEAPPPTSGIPPHEAGPLSAVRLPFHVRRRYQNVDHMDLARSPVDDSRYRHCGNKPS